MTFARLILRSLLFHWRGHLGVVAGTAIAAAVLTGALIVGDSVQHTLHRQALTRIGRVDLVIATRDRLFQASLVERLAGATGNGQMAAVLQVRGIALTDTGLSAHEVNVLGIDERFFSFAPDTREAAALIEDRALVNERLRAQLDLSIGQRILLRIEQPSALPRDAVLGSVEDISLGVRVEVDGVLEEDRLGRFSLRADQIPPYNVFVPITWLQDQLGMEARANTLLIDSDGQDVEALNSALAQIFEIEDAQLRIAGIAGVDRVELASDRIFIEPDVESAFIDSNVGGLGVLTYFVSGIEYDDRSTPYSMVAGVGPLLEEGVVEAGDAVPLDLSDDEIVINEWLAEDLQCAAGDELTLRYFVLDVEDHLMETTASFTVRSIAAMQGLAADRTLMPEFPGIADAENSRDWQPGIPIDLGRIRDKDEAYWDEHRGTPKAFVSLAAAKKMWGNRYGELTSIRVPLGQRGRVRQALRDSIDPAELGFFAQDVRSAALRASRSPTNFAGLFLGLSFFLIIASLLLTALLFVFSAERRSREIGAMLAVGYRGTTVRRLLMGEAVLLAWVGGVIGALAGVAYTRGILGALSGVWRDAVASASIELHVVPATLLIGGGSAVLAAAIAMRLTLIWLTRCPPARLLAGNVGPGARLGARASHRPYVTIAIAVAAALAAVLIIALVGADSRSAASAFFGSGALMLIAVVALCRLLLRRRRAPAEAAAPSVPGLAWANATRRINRSLTTMSLLACGIFLVLAVAVNRIDAHRDAAARESGTGGFAFIGASAIPVHLNLNEQRGRDVFGLTDAEMTDVQVVSLRVRDGDDASCLNLNQAQQPRLMGVDPRQLDSRGAFRFVRLIEEADRQQPWQVLEVELPGGVVPAIVDDTSATWALHKSIGDTIEYVDGQGKSFQVMIAGTIAGSIVQGNVLIAERRFRALYPNEQGFRAFLIDAPLDGREDVRQRLSRQLSDVGLELTPAAERLAEYSDVQNTYLAIFQMLGGLGLLLGTVGMGIVVMRNVSERRGELAVLRAVGFSLRLVRRLVLAEHLLILLLGLGSGSIAAIVAVIPALRSETADLPMVFSGLLLAALLANGLFWAWLAVRWTVSGPMLEALRRE